MNYIPNSSGIKLCWGSDLSRNNSYHFTSESFLHRSEHHQLMVSPAFLRPLLRDIICVKDYANLSYTGLPLSFKQSWQCPLIPDWVDVVTLNCNSKTSPIGKPHVGKSLCIEDCQLHVVGELTTYLVLVGSTVILLSVLVYLIDNLLAFKTRKQL